MPQYIAYSSWTTSTLAATASCLCPKLDMKKLKTLDKLKIGRTDRDCEKSTYQTG